MRMCVGNEKKESKCACGSVKETKESKQRKEESEKEIGKYKNSFKDGENGGPD